MTEEELQDLITEAEAGDVETQCWLGYYYRSQAEEKLNLFRNLPSGSPTMRAPYNIGERNPITDSAIEDRKQAFYWFQRAAERGIADAVYALSECHARGEGTPIFLEKARELLERAADMGQFEAQYDLGMKLLGEKKFKSAVSWLSKAAAQNDSFAQYQLALCYEEGTGVEQNTETAIEWYEKAAALGDVRAFDALDRLK